ncbi:MAG: RNA polymerase sigma factor [Bacteroidota bacterium]
MKAHHTDQQTLIHACLTGNRKAKRALYEQYRIPMFRVCMRYAPSREIAEDLLQEGFYQVFKDLKQFRGEGELGGWINKIMVRTALSYLRRQRKFGFQNSHQESPSDLFDGEASMLSDFGTNHIMKVLQSLPPGYRAVFNLYAIEGYTHKEVAAQLNIAESSSRSQYVRARHLLQKLLQHEKISS